jgi:radical SAM protein with 4Fe4S-binding SPASM domain
MEDNSVLLDRQISFKSSISYHNVNGRFLVIFVDTGCWFTTDYIGNLLFGRLANGLSPIEAVIDVYKEKKQFTLAYFLDHISALLEQIVVSGILSKNIIPKKPEEIIPPLTLCVTKRCNLLCRHCYNSSGLAEDNQLSERIELSTEEILSIIHNYSGIVKEGNITITGGEPLMRSDIEIIIMNAKQFGHHIALFTNGTLLNNDICSKLLKYLDSIQISLDGTNKDVHDSIRGIGSFEKTWSAINFISTTQTNLDVAITINPQNALDFKNNAVAFSKMVSDINCNIRVAVAKPEGRALENYGPFDRVIFEPIAIELVKTLSKYNKKHTPYSNPQKRYSCGFGPGIHIDWDGSIFPCKELPELKVGNIKSQCIKDLQAEILKVYMKTNVEMIPECSNCDLKYICTGGCRIENRKKNGSYIVPNCTAESRQRVYNLMILA